MDTTDAPQIIEHINKSIGYTPYDVKWVPCSNRLVSMGIMPNSKGALQVYALNKGELELVNDMNNISHGVKCGTFGASSLEDRHLATGDHAGKLNIYDLEYSAADANSGTSQTVFSQQAHSSIINAIDGCGGGSHSSGGYGAPEIVTGGRDGCVRLWDIRVPEPVLALEPNTTTPTLSSISQSGAGASGPGAAPTTRDCWSVAFGNSYNDEERCIVAGYDNGDIKLFDLRTNTMRYETNISNGVTCAEFDRKDIEMNKLVVTTLESRIRLFDMRTQHPTGGFTSLIEKAHKSTVWCCRHLPQNRDLFMTGGGNGGLNIYKYNYPAARSRVLPSAPGEPENHPIGVMGSVELLNSKVISTQPVVNIDWNVDKEVCCYFLFAFLCVGVVIYF